MRDFDAVCGIGSTYFFFKNNRYWKVKDDKVVAGYPKQITHWNKALQGPFDAVCAVSGDSGVIYYFFKGLEYWKLEGTKLIAKRHIRDWSETLVEGAPFDAVCAISRESSNLYFFFKRDKYWRVQGDSADPARNISEWNEDLAAAAPFDAVCGISRESHNDYYFFKGSEYWKLKGNSIRDGYPKNVSAWGFVPWMENLPGDRLLSELSLPGTHDSCSLYDYTYTHRITIKIPNPLGDDFTITKDVASFRVPDTAKCQELSLKSQLYAGVRCLDVRINGDNLRAWHGSGEYSVDQKMSMNEIFEVCERFLEDFPNESIVMSLKHERGKEIGAAVHKAIKANPGLWYTKSEIPKLKSVRGKIVLLRRFSYSRQLGIDLSRGWIDNTDEFTISSAGQPSFVIQDKYDPRGGRWYAVCKRKWGYVKDMLEKCSRNAQSTKDWYINFASGIYMQTVNIPDKGPVHFPDTTDIAEYVNPKLAAHVEEYAKCGTVMMDFVDLNAVSEIIGLNF